MAIPGQVVAEPPWVELTREGKHARVLAAAGELFAREGIEAAMPDVARAVGVGVGSLYRQFESKDDLVAALVLHQVGHMQRVWGAAADGPDTWAALRGAVLATVDVCVTDGIAQQAWMLSSGRDDVAAAHGALIEAIERLVAAARAQGVLRADACADDLRLLFRGARQAEGVAPGGARRLAELVLAGLRA